MHVEIVVDTKSTDTSRGYHDRVTTVTFKYGSGGHRYTDVKETEIVSAITTGYWMWYNDRGSVKNVDGSVTYTRQYGYDSGD